VNCERPVCRADKTLELLGIMKPTDIVTAEADGDGTSGVIEVVGMVNKGAGSNVSLTVNCIDELWITEVEMPPEGIDADDEGATDDGISEAGAMTEDSIAAE
jgi:hypothetical protein